MVEIQRPNFQIFTGQASPQAPRQLIQENSSFISLAKPDRSFIIGSKETKLPDVFATIKSGGIPELPQEMGNLQATLSDRLIVSRNSWKDSAINFSNDQRFGLLLREVNIPRIGKMAQRIAWLLAVPLTETGEVDSTALDSARVLFSTYAESQDVSTFNNHLIGGLALLENDGKVGVNFEAYDPAKKTYSSYVVLPETVKDKITQGDRERLVYSAALFADMFRKAYAEADVLSRIHMGFSPLATMVQTAETDGWDSVMRFLAGDLLRLGDEASQGVHTLSQQSKDLVGLLKIASGKRFRFSAQAEKERISMHAAIFDGFNKAADNFEWGGKKMTRSDAYKELALQEDPEIRLDLYRHFILHFSKEAAREKGLFASIDKFNAMVRDIGGKDTYADVTYRDRFGMDTTAFFDFVKSYMAETDGLAKQHIERLRLVNKRINPESGDTIFMQDVGYLSSLPIDSESSETPPLLTIEQARDIETSIYRDLGFDFAQTPWKDIFVDDQRRLYKAPVAGEALAVDNESSYYIMNMEASGLSLDEVETMIHERLHTVHFQSAIKRAKGSMMVKELWGGPDQWPEGIAMAAQNLLKNPEIAHRYLGKYGYSREYLETRAKSMEAKIAWDRRYLLMIAMQEIMMYRKTIPGSDVELNISERLGLWKKWCKELLHVEMPEGVDTGDWVAKPHPFSKDAYLYYAAYPMGVIQAEKILNNYIKEGTVEEMQAAGEELRRLLGLGSLITASDIESAIAQPRH